MQKTKTHISGAPPSACDLIREGRKASVSVSIVLVRTSSSHSASCCSDGGLMPLHHAAIAAAAAGRYSEIRDAVPTLFIPAMHLHQRRSIRGLSEGVSTSARRTHRRPTALFQPESVCCSDFSKVGSKRKTVYGHSRRKHGLLHPPAHRSPLRAWTPERSLPAL